MRIGKACNSRIIIQILTTHIQAKHKDIIHALCQIVRHRNARLISFFGLRHAAFSSGNLCRTVKCDDLIGNRFHFICSIDQKMQCIICRHFQNRIAHADFRHLCPVSVQLIDPRAVLLHINNRNRRLFLKHIFCFGFPVKQEEKERNCRNKDYNKQQNP